jgi:hypothetical protein
LAQISVKLNEGDRDFSLVLGDVELSTFLSVGGR